jgi:hypothetical protein
MNAFTKINTPADITQDVIDVIETIHEGYYEDEPRIDWHRFLERVEIYAGVDLGSNMDSPAIKHIKKIVKGIRDESR